MLELLTRSDCIACAGSGLVQHPLWAEFWASHQEASGLTADDAKAWFREQGQDSPPPEEITCKPCAGRGYHRGTVSLTELRALLEQPAPRS